MVCGKEELKEHLLALAEVNNLVPTAYFEKIVNAKEHFGLTLRCPCDRDNPERYCISDLCKADIERDKTCHCCCWMKKIVYNKRRKVSNE